MSDRPKSRRPEAWPPLILRTFTLATRTEILIPLESPEKVQAFKRLLHDVRRSFREHSHPDADAINILRALEYRTHEIQAERGAYLADPDLYPYTVCLSPALGFSSNLEAALEHTVPSNIPNSPPVDMSREELERELTSIMREEACNDDANEVAEFFRSRQK